MVIQDSLPVDIGKQRHQKVNTHCLQIIASFPGSTLQLFFVQSNHFLGEWSLGTKLQKYRMTYIGTCSLFAGLLAIGIENIFLHWNKYPGGSY